MPDLFAFISPDGLASADDPVTALKMAPTRAVLVADLSYDPDHTKPWPRAAIVQVENPPLQIVNRKSGALTAACVCHLET
jgi:hypothetical protein